MPPNTCNVSDIPSPRCDANHLLRHLVQPTQTACVLGRSGVCFRVGSITSSKSAPAGIGRARGCNQAKSTTNAPKRSTASCHTLVTHPCSGPASKLSLKVLQGRDMCIQRRCKYTLRNLPDPSMVIESTPSSLWIGNEALQKLYRKLAAPK